VKPSHRAALRPLGLAAVGVALDAGAAQAHLVTTGLGPIYDGAAHLVLSPEDLVPLLALALLAGQRGPAGARTALFAVTASWLLGGALGLLTAQSVGDLLPAISFLLLGALVAADLRLPIWLVGCLASVFGVAHGFADGSALPSDGSGVRMLLGIVSTVFVVCALVASLAVPLRSQLARTALRVAGSWIAATGVLLLGWSLRSLFRVHI
jgi:urease accessory protein